MKLINKIPIISSTVEPFRDGKTLIWLKDQVIDSGRGRWGRWDCIATSTRDIDRWANSGENIEFDSLFLLDIEDDNASTEAVIRKYSKNIKNIFVTDEVYSSLGGAVFWNSLVGSNIIHISAFPNKYRHIPDIDIDNCHDVIAAYAILFKYNRIVGFTSDCLTTGRQEHLKRIGCVCVAEAVPPQLWFVTQYFVHSNSKRAREFRKCLMYNCDNSLVDRVLLLTEKDLSSEYSGFRHSDKIQQVVIGERLKYSHLLQATIDIVPTNCITVFANADIFLNQTIAEVYTIDMKDKMLALLRWDTNEQGEEEKLFGPRPDSQDTWIVLSDCVKERKWKMEQFDYQLGRAGCDNRFTSDMFSNRFLVVNPCHTIKTMHIHKTAIRDYNPAECIPAKFYLHVAPNRLVDFHQVKFPEGKPIEKLPSEQFPVTIRCPNKTNGVTWCAMISRLKRFVWEHEVEQQFGGNEKKVWEIADCFVKSWNYVYDNKKIYLGENISEFLKNSNVEYGVDIAAKTVCVPNMLVIPIHLKEWMQDIDLCLLYYFSRVLRLLKTMDRDGKKVDWHFWMPSVLDEFFNKINITNLVGVPWKEEYVAYTPRAIGCLPEVNEIGREDIEVLRQFIGWKKSADEKQCVVIYDENMCNEVFIERLQEILGDWTIKVHRGGTETGCDFEKMYEKIVGNGLCIFFGGPKREKAWSRLWALPLRARVIEIQNELKTDGVFQHMAGAAGLESWIMTVYKGSADDMRKQALGHIEKWWTAG